MADAAELGFDFLQAREELFGGERSFDEGGAVEEIGLAFGAADGGGGVPSAGADRGDAWRAG